ncbi:MAG: sodium:solute symporter family protein [Candidatus Palauibacterales bacterium]|nr:sodium:solute symporter family protein [Candidatus Palauibacterales bacterium]MDP2482585.1 sodium:solute symporter family protein [Candidatus Palauibacterales bacterium]
MNATLLFLLAYSAGLIALGLWIGRRVKETGSFFVAGRSLGPVLLFATVLAANIGAGSTVGAAGLGYRDGLAAWWWVGSAAIGTALLAFWIGPRIWRVAKQQDLYTVGDYLELRYGPSVRGIVAALLWLATLAILAGQLIAFAWILEVVAGIPKWAGCLIAGGVMTIYFTAGGLLTSAWVNLVQLVVLIIGFAIALPWALSAAGGWQAVVATAPARSDYFGFFSGGGSGIIYVALLVPAFIISPGLIQKVYGARDERTVRLGVGLSAAALLLFAAVPPVIGILAHAFAPELANQELALPTVLTLAVPPAVGAIGLAAVFSAEVSSADAILFMLSTSLSEDLYKRFVKPGATDRQVLGVARRAAVLGGAAAVALALGLPSVIGALSVFYTFLGVSLFVPVVVGLHSRRPGTPEALWAIGAGVLLVLAARLAGVSGLNSSLLTGYAILYSAVVFTLVFAVRGLRAKRE